MKEFYKHAHIVLYCVVSKLYELWQFNSRRK